ncbi:MtrB/PioB family decaheme-associated outer membrane protein [Blastochloris viridis]|uniref:Decaheme-associated outer membrane protein, MtrB/PioB family n=1 Tax=Blastochloris viridis TaxID=1079 RepID=A0A0H5BCX0_BLAVI|nr:MtrB/PioB family decaheme-associated outer membrane protein [Blastochloris viridis]ALK08575.1 hypothetical protein BVIR_782 [Blastochloris viridis]BAR98136.1 outer membrane porin required for phototropic Fe(II) oxidation [Blastochloris viridis]CUU41238.1 decaheme-associated outer membrane protein, MtrB/PioB family [Blastochloris viridis]
MKVNGGMTLTGVLLIAAGSALSHGARAQETMAAPPSGEALKQALNGPWAEHGGVETWGVVEAGFRAFIERPPHSALPGVLPGGRPATAPTATGGGLPAPVINTDRNNRAKFEEYGDISPGFYLEKLTLGGQTKDGDYFAELRADNVGNNNQRYIFDWSKAGEIYGTYAWDQIPHLYSTSAQSIWNGVGTNVLTTPVIIGNPGQNGLAAERAMYDALQGNLQTIDIGIQRDKFTAMQRWTPNQNWDVRADYSHERREGSQVAGAVIGGIAATNQQIMQLPAPVADTTQNAKLAGQYYGDALWGGKFNVKTSASVSSYANDFDSYTFTNPFYVAGNANYPQYGRVSLSPDNQAYNVAATTGVDLPNKSRYMGTVSYTMMRQDDAFIPLSTNPLNANTSNVLPASSADAKVNTLLVNNVLNTPLSKDVKSTLRYRYYDNDNNTAELLMPAFVVEDGAGTGSLRRNLAYGYTKQNASEELTWRADKDLTLGGLVGWEQYDRDRRSVDVTNEIIGKVYLDTRFNDDLRLRSSYQYSERAYDNYDFQSIARYIYYASTTVGVTNFYMRQFDLADRDRQKANVSLEWAALENLTVTPTLGLRFDDYETDPDAGELGLLKDRNWNAGIEVAYAVSPGTTLMLAYVREDFDRDLVGSVTTNTVAAGPVIGSRFFSNMVERVNTYIASANIELIPDTLDLRLSYSYAHADEDWSAEAFGATSQCLNTAAAPNNVTNLCQPFPTVTTDYQRFEAVLKYRLDSGLVTKLGLVGDVVFKLRYAWERNEVENWQNDLATPYMYLVDGAQVRNISLAAYNPNYDVQLITASLAIKW